MVYPAQSSKDWLLHLPASPMKKFMTLSLLLPPLADNTNDDDAGSSGGMVVVMMMIKTIPQ